MASNSCSDALTCEQSSLSLEQLIRKFILASAGDCLALRVVTADGSETGEVLSVRKTDLTNTAYAIKATAGNLLGFNIINPNAVDVYVKFYNKVAGSVVVGTDVPVLTLMVPATGSVYQQPDCVQQEFATAMSMAVTTGLADNNTTAPTTAIHINVKYK